MGIPITRTRLTEGTGTSTPTSFIRACNTGSDPGRLPERRTPNVEAGTLNQTGVRPPESPPEATLRLSGSQPVGTQRLPRGYPQATLKLPSGYPQATPR